jgi:predicted nucleic acid-binding protein
MRELKLEDMQRGSMVFIDTNIITYHLSGHNIFGGTSRNFLKGVESAEYESYINDVVLSEVLLNYVKSELFRRRGIKPHRVVREIKREPSLLGLEYKCKELVEVISGYFLLPNDAIHVATMKRYGITNIATNDPDFERVEWLKVWKP